MLSSNNDNNNKNIFQKKYETLNIENLPNKPYVFEEVVYCLLTDWEGKEK